MISLPVSLEWVEVSGDSTAGVVLAGGRSSRMGTPKAALEWHGSTLLYRTTALLARTVTGPVVVVAAPGQELPDLPLGVRCRRGPRRGPRPDAGHCDRSGRSRRQGSCGFRLLDRHAVSPSSFPPSGAARVRGARHRRRSAGGPRFPSAARSRLSDGVGRPRRESRRRRQPSSRDAVQALPRERSWAMPSCSPTPIWRNSTQSWTRW